MHISCVGMGSIVAAALFGTAGVAATARDMDQLPKAVVSTRDLDLSTETGVAKARARVRRAAESVCGDYPRVGILPPAVVARCRTTAAREANASVAALASRASDGGAVLASTANRMR
jgi:UrcA family protein